MKTLSVTPNTQRIRQGYDTLTEAIQDLTKNGYTHDFNILASHDCLVCNKTQLQLSPKDFEIDATYRFEGESDPGDEMIIFAISSPTKNVKGIVVNAFGVYADTESTEIVEKLYKRPKSDTKPIKRHPALIQLSREHHFGLLLVWKIRQGLKKSIEAERISNYTLYFHQEELLKHFKEEEEVLFDNLAKNDTLRKQALEDHAHINELAGKVKDNKYDTELLLEFAEVLENHIRYEERTLFNYLQKILPENQLLKLAAPSGNPVNVDDKWEDHFWEYKK